MITLEEYRKLKRTADEMKAAADRATGAREELLKRMRKDFGCSTVKEARKKLELLQTSIAEKEESFHRAVSKLKKKWRHLSEEGE